MKEKYDGWIAKDRDGKYWPRSFRSTKVETQAFIDIELGDIKDIFEFKPIKVRLVEVE